MGEGLGWRSARTYGTCQDESCAAVCEPLTQRADGKWCCSRVHRPVVVADKHDLTLRERMVLAHERGELHNSEVCPTCEHGRFMYRLGERAAVREIAAGA